MAKNQSTAAAKKGRPATNAGRVRMSIFLEGATHEAVRVEAARLATSAQALIDGILKKSLKVV